MVVKHPLARSSRLALLPAATCLAFIVACGDGSPDQAAATEMPHGSGEFDYVQEKVELSKDLVVPAGQVVRVGPGVTFHASKGVQIKVAGQLLVAGTAASQTQFLGSGEPRSWQGIVVEDGGKLELKHAQVEDATYAIQALAGSDFTVQDSVLGGSFKAAVVQSDGSFTRTRFEAAPATTFSFADAVTAEDPNGTLTIMDASPSISNCQFDGATSYTDMVRIGGNAAPTFDHVYLRNAHCGFHTNGGVNTSARITNAIFENLAYGVMAYTTKPVIQDSVFRANNVDVGICMGATTANAPQLRNNHYEAGKPMLDATCTKIGTEDPAPAATPNPSAGPSGL